MKIHKSIRWIVTAVLVPIVVAVIAKYAENISWSGAFGRLWQWLLEFLFFGIPLWCVCLLVLAMFGIWRLSRNYSTGSSMQRTHDATMNYTTDIIEGIKWYWDWTRYGGKWAVDPDSLRAHCPTDSCMGLLVEIPKFGAYTPPILYCEHCGFRKECDMPNHELRNKVGREIYRRVLTNQWKAPVEGIG